MLSSILSYSSTISCSSTILNANYDCNYVLFKHFLAIWEIIKKILPIENFGGPELVRETIDAFSTTQFGTIDTSSAHQFGLVDTFNTITSTRIGSLGLFLDNLEGELENSKHILVIRGLKSITYQLLYEHCWIPLSITAN